MKYLLLLILLLSGCVTYEDKWVGLPDRVPQMEVCDKKDGRYYYEHIDDTLQEIKEPADKEEIDELADEYWGCYLCRKCNYCRSQSQN